MIDGMGGGTTVGVYLPPSDSECEVAGSEVGFPRESVGGGAHVAEGEREMGPRRGQTSRVSALEVSLWTPAVPPAAAVGRVASVRTPGRLFLFLCDYEFTILPWFFRKG